MSLYNTVFGMNAELVLFTSLIMGFRIDKEIPRFRDVYGTTDDCPIDTEYDVLIYTRMGGGNYSCWNDNECQEGNLCPFCHLKELEKEPWYAGGYDAEFDNTYRTLLVKFTPEQHIFYDKINAGGVSLADVFGEDKIKEMFPELWQKENKEGNSDA